VKNLAHSASLQLLDKIAPSKFGIKHLAPRKAAQIRRSLELTIEVLRSTHAPKQARKTSL
jgi:hypothetical protein